MDKQVYERLNRVEAVTNAMRSSGLEMQYRCYALACERQNEQEAAYYARKIRNALLDESDKEMTLDRLGLDTSSATKFIASIVKIFSGDWAKYRQALRDLPQQLGFPYDIEFPVMPGTEKESNGMKSRGEQGENSREPARKRHIME